MGDPTGEADKSGLRLDFDRRLMLQFRGSAIISDGGLLAYRELVMRWASPIQVPMPSPIRAPAKMVAIGWPACCVNRCSGGWPATRT